MLSDNMIRLINGWTKAALIARLRDLCSGIERSPERLVTPNGRCCAIGALLPPASRDALRAWESKEAKQYQRPGFTEPTGTFSVKPYLDVADPGWVERLPFALEPDGSTPYPWGNLMDAFDSASNGERPLDVALAWVERYVEE